MLLQLYASKICSYAQGMNLIRAAGEMKQWALDLGEIARIWKGGCIIRAVFLDRSMFLSHHSLFRSICAGAKTLRCS